MDGLVKKEKAKYSEPSPDDSNDDSSVSPLSIPFHAKVEYVQIDGTPGLHVGTRCTRSWTPIAARTWLKFKNFNLMN